MRLQGRLQIQKLNNVLPTVWQQWPGEVTMASDSRDKEESPSAHNTLLTYIITWASLIIIQVIFYAK